MTNIFPKHIKKALLWIKALDIPKSLRIIQDILYLWREFYIKTKITPVVKEYKISFYYKDQQLISTKITSIEEIIGIMNNIKKMRV